MNLLKQKLLFCFLVYIFSSAMVYSNTADKKRFYKISKEGQKYLKKRIYWAVKSAKKDRSKLSLSLADGRFLRGEVAKWAKSKLALRDYKGKLSVIHFGNLKARSAAKLLSKGKQTGKLLYYLGVWFSYEGERNWSINYLQKAVKKGYQPAIATLNKEKERLRLAQKKVKKPKVSEKKIMPSKKAKQSQYKFFWPPKLNEAYPNLKLTDQTGRTVELASFKGKVILIEPIGMNCPGCQAFVGAHRFGAYGNVRPQPGLKSIEEYFPRFAKGVSLSNKKIVYIQLLLYDMSVRKAPTPEDAKKWAHHFKMKRAKNRIVLAGSKELLGSASYKMIPGFQLIDKNFILRSDSTGHHPQHNLYNHLLPMVPKLLHKR